MFGSKQQEREVKQMTPHPTAPTAPAAPERRTTPEATDQKMNSILGRGSQVNGTIRSEGSIRIDGDFEGNIESADSLVVGKEGIVRAEAKVKRAVIGGRFEGNIHASVKVELHAGCEMLGEVVTPSLVIEEGVLFEGNCKMGAKPGQTRDAKSAPPKPAMSGMGGPTSPTGTPSTAVAR